MKKHKKGSLSTVILIVVFLIGLSLLLYPTVSDYWNKFHQSQAIAEYVEAVADMDDDTYDQMLADAHAYNDSLTRRSNSYILSDEHEKRYDELLNVSGLGIMGYIEIPEINCSLPIYHGTDAAVLQIAIGHIEWSSLPVGGASTHCVLSGHRGLPSAKLFTDLDKLEIGDTFMLRVLDEVLTYEVDQILIVEPEDTSALLIEPGMDYCTLVTCTPYGVNTHRLLVRGHRVANGANASSVRVTADAMRVDPMIVAPIVAVPVLALLFVGTLIRTRKRKRG